MLRVQIIFALFSFAASSDTLPGAARPRNATSERPIDACIKSLCPNGVGQYSSLSDKIKKFVVTKNELPQLQKALDAAIEAEKLKDADNMDLMKTFIAQGGELKNPKAIELFQLAKYIDKVSSVSINSDLSLNVSGTKANWPGVTDRELKIMSRLLATYRDVQKTLPTLLRDELEGREGDLTVAEIHSQVKEIRAKYVAQFEEFRKNYGESFTIGFNNDLVRGPRAARILNGNYNLVDLMTLSSDATSLLVFANLLKDEELKKLLPKGKVDLSSYENIIRVESARYHLLQPGGPESLIAVMKRSCIGGAKTVMSILPDRETLKEFRKKELEWRSKFQNGIGPYLSGQTRGEFANKASKWQLFLPKTPEEFEKDMIESLNAIASQSEYERLQLKDIKTKKDLELYAAGWMGQHELGGALPLKKTTDVCDNAETSLLPDSFKSGTDNVILGPITMIDTHNGPPVAFHEYAHNLDQFLNGKDASEKSKGWHSDVRNCLKTFYKSESFVDEDFADMVASTVPGANVGCVFFTPNPKKWSLKPDPEDPDHSSDFFRVIHGALERGNDLSQSCLNAIKQTGNKLTARKCLNSAD